MRNRQFFFSYLYLLALAGWDPESTVHNHHSRLHPLSHVYLFLFIMADRAFSIPKDEMAAIHHADRFTMPEGLIQFEVLSPTLSALPSVSVGRNKRKRTSISLPSRVLVHVRISLSAPYPSSRVFLV